ncbi:hypothetical protein COOONC_20688 [Cooperia oncophora]
MLEVLNPDIIIILCSFLDLASLTSLAAVYPHWSSLILRSVKTKIWALKLRILPQHTTIEYHSVDKPRDEEEISKRDLVEGNWEQLPRFSWENVPFHMMTIGAVDITQFGSSELPERVISVLSTVSAGQLSLKFETREEARKVLQAISFNPGSTVYLHELSFRIAKEPFLQQAKFENVKDLWFTGDMLSEDLSLLLNSDIPSLCLNSDSLRQSCVTIIKDYIKRFLDGKTAQKSCRISASGGLLRYMFEGIGGRGETRLSNGSRKVHLYDGLEETPIHCFIDAMDDST